MAILSVSLIDAAGSLVERHVVACRFGCAGPGSLTTSVVERLERAAEAAGTTRIARVQRRLAHAAARHVETERAVSERIHALTSPGEAQLGLFSASALREFDAARARAGDMMQTTRARLDALRAAATISVRARLELVVS